MTEGEIFTFLRERMEDETSASLKVACRALADHLRVLSGPDARSSAGTEHAALPDWAAKAANDMYGSGYLLSSLKVAFIAGIKCALGHSGAAQAAQEPLAWAYFIDGNENEPHISSKRRTSEALRQKPWTEVPLYPAVQPPAAPVKVNAASIQRRERIQAALDAGAPASPSSAENVQPFMWICLVRDGLHIGAWTRDAARAAKLNSQGLDMTPLYVNEPQTLSTAMERALSQYDKTIDRAKEDTALSEAGRNRVIEDCIAAKGAIKNFVKDFEFTSALSRPNREG